MRIRKCGRRKAKTSRTVVGLIEDLAGRFAPAQRAARTGARWRDVGTGVGQKRDGSGDGLTLSLLRLRVLRSGGHPWSETEALAPLREAGFGTTAAAANGLTNVICLEKPQVA